MTKELEETTEETEEITFNQRAISLVHKRITELTEYIEKIEKKALDVKNNNLDECSPNAIKRVKKILELNKGLYDWIKRVEGHEIH